MISNEPWYVDSQVYSKLQSTSQKSGYCLLKGGPADCQNVAQLYQKSPINGKDIESVEVIHNLAMIRQFEARLSLLNERRNNPIFDPKWGQENDLSIRQMTHQTLSQITNQHKSSYPFVQLYPAFHGTKAALIDSILKIGFANLGTTDNGFFGKGMYGTQYADYAHRVYSDGTLLLNWVAFYSAYPVTLSDMPKLQGSANHSNYDAHYALTAPKNPLNPNEVVYHPITQGQKHTYDELVVFESAQILPRYLITLKPDLMHLQTLAPKATGVNLITAISSYFPEAPSTLQLLLQKELVALTSQLMTPLNFGSLSLLTLIERTKGETDPAIKLHLANKIAKALDDSASTSSSPALQPAPPQKGLKEIRTLQGGNCVSNLLELADGSLTSTGYWNNTIKIWNLKTGSSTHSLEGYNPGVRSLVQLADGSLLCGSGGIIKIWNPITGSCIQNLHTKFPTGLLVPMADGSVVGVGAIGYTIEIWNPKTGSSIQSFRGHKKSISALIRLKDGSLASGSCDGTIKIWNPETSACIQTLVYQHDTPLVYQHHKPVNLLVELPDGTIAGGNSDGTIKIWNPKTGSCIKTLKMSNYSVSFIFPLKDGTIAASCDEGDHIIKIWDPITDSCIQILSGHEQKIKALAQLSDGSLVSGSEDGIIKIWGN